MKNCYKVIVRFKELTDSHLPSFFTYEVMAETPEEAEEKTILDHRKEWEAEHVFDCIKAVFPCND